ncbi:MAG: hypothetical protein L6437_13685 [Kiritimatiellae bacterium]|nr:hypothetical protein [Kiritimatiellia bacterium]MCG2680698.1 hypothetical protein [Kiritimatiellia bacterium]
MCDVLPELKKGDVLIRESPKGDVRAFTVIKVGRGNEFDEPVYYLQGMYGVKLKQPYNGEELASLGYRLKEEAVTSQNAGAGGAP